VDPNQKENHAFAAKNGARRWFLETVNDAPAMHSDTALSVEEAVDVARQPRFVLLEKHLDVIRYGIERRRELLRTR
jgi:hypothetical protein